VTPPLPDRIAAAIDAYAQKSVVCGSRYETGPIAARTALCALIAEVVAERDRYNSEIHDAHLALTYQGCQGKSLVEKFRVMQGAVDEAAAALAKTERELAAAKELHSMRWRELCDTLDKAEQDRDAARDEAAKAKDEAAREAREAAGYQKIAKEAANAEPPGLLVLLVDQDGQEVRIFGPDRDAEERFGETVARWWKLLQATFYGIELEERTKERDAATKRADGLDEKWARAIAEALMTTFHPRADNSVEVWAAHVRREHDAHTRKDDLFRKACNDRDAARTDLAAAQAKLAEVDRKRQILADIAVEAAGWLAGLAGRPSCSCDPGDLAKRLLSIAAAEQGGA
jgi:hypothetical protein